MTLKQHAQAFMQANTAMVLMPGICQAADQAERGPNVVSNRYLPAPSFWRAYRRALRNIKEKP